MKKIEDNKGYVIRFSVTDRIAHIILFITLIMLMVSGLSLSFYNSGFGRFIINLEGGYENKGLVHIIFAVLLMVISVYHLLYIIFSDRGQQEISNFKYRKKDFGDFIIGFKYNFGLSKEKPKFGKYNLSQKFQYWGVVFGSLLMILTGMVLLLKVKGVGMIVPKWLWDITNVVHSSEGLLIFLVLFVWHIYDVHLSPGVFPMSKVWLDGKMSKEELKKSHILEYEKLFGDEIKDEK
jgi:formate dehydrogenase subunit gamma